MRRIVGVVAIVAGLMMVGFVFTEHVFSRSNDAQTVADHYRGLMSRQGLADLRSGFESVKAAGAQLDTQTEPQLRASLHMNQQQFDAYRAQQLPGIAAFDANARTVVAIVDPVIGQMEAERADYRRADQIPTGWLPMTIAPWAFLGFGTLLIASGAYALWKRSRLSIAIVGGVAVVLVAAPLVLGIPGKVDAAQRVTKIGEIGLAPATGQKAVGATKLFDGMAADVQTKVAPAMGPAFARDFPQLASFVAEWQSSTSAKSHALSDSQVALAPTFANANKIPLAPIPWLFIVSGLVLAALAGAALIPVRRAATAGTSAQPDIAPAQ